MITKHHSSHSVQVGDTYFESNIESRVIDAEYEFNTNANKQMVDRAINDIDLYISLTETAEWLKNRNNNE